MKLRWLYLCFSNAITTTLFLAVSVRWNVTSVEWQVTLCDPICHVSSRSGEAGCELPYSVYSTLLYRLLFVSIILTVNLFLSL